MRLPDDCTSRLNAALHFVVERMSTRYNLAMGLLVTGLFLFDSVAARAVQLDGLSQILHIWPGLVFVSTGILVCKWYPLPRFIESCENAIWAILLFDLFSVLIVIAGRSPYPLVDGSLSQIDRHWHFGTAGIAHFAAHYPSAEHVLSITYSLVPLLIMTAVLLPPFVGRAEATQRYLISLVLAIFATAILFAFWPAAGPWTTENLAPSGAQLQVTRYLTALKSHARVTLDFQSAAIVSFPSFHVVLAILSSIALSGIARVRVVAWILAIFTCVSTLTTGWHYGVDLVGGLAVAGMAHYAACAISPYLKSTKANVADGFMRAAVLDNAIGLAVDPRRA